MKVGQGALGVGPDTMAQSPCGVAVLMCPREPEPMSEELGLLGPAALEMSPLPT